MAADNDGSADTADTGERQQLTDHQASQIRVLHVDDAPDIIEMNRRHLEDHDERIELDIARSVADGRERFAEESFDCLVSDYEMPGTNGIEFCETLREENIELPFILYTSTSCGTLATEALSAGVTDYVQKRMGTAHLAVLANRIVRAVEARRSQQTRNRLFDVLETLEDGFGLLDEDGRFIYVNDAYAEYVGADANEVIGENLGYIYQEPPNSGEDGHFQADDAGRSTTTLRTDTAGEHVLVRTGHDGLVCAIRESGNEHKTDE
jgi:PAS domain S-box-containing protein